MKYLKLASLGYKRIFVYRGSVFLILLSSVISMFILNKFWYALYRNDLEQYRYMLNYAVISQILRIIYRFNSPSNLAAKIQNGAISVELLRPWEYIHAMLFEDLGTIAGNLMSSGLILFLAGKIFFDVAIPPIGNILLFFVSAVLGFMVLFLVKNLISMLCFWLVEASMFLILIGVVINLMSGQFLPTWLVPSWMERIMNALPFVWIYQKPISVYLGASGTETFRSGEMLLIIGLQLMWILVLYLFLCWLWNRAVKKLSVQGG